MIAQVPGDFVRLEVLAVSGGRSQCQAYVLLALPEARTVSRALARLAPEACPGL